MKIDTTTGSVIIAPRDVVDDVVGGFERSRAKWNIFKVNDRYPDSFLVLSNNKSNGVVVPVVVVVKNANLLESREWAAITDDLRQARHNCRAYVFGFKSLKQAPEIVRTLAKTNLFD